MNYLNDYALDELANRVVESYLKKVAEPRERLDPVALCEKVLGLRVFCRTLSMDLSILGVTSFGNAKINVLDDDGDWVAMPLLGKTVLVEKALADDPGSVGRFNFTVAHEAAHHIYRMIGQDGDGGNRLLVYRWAKERVVDFDEWQTDRLAAALLMNRKMLSAAMREAGIPGGIKVLDDRLDNGSWSGFCRVAEILGVSLTALEKRMLSLRLIDRDYYHREKGSILDVY